METKTLETWFSAGKQEQMIDRLIRKVGLTRVRANCFLHLWIYALIQENKYKPPLSELIFLSTSVIALLSLSDRY